MSPISLTALSLTSALRFASPTIHVIISRGASSNFRLRRTAHPLTVMIVHLPPASVSTIPIRVSADYLHPNLMPKASGKLVFHFLIIVFSFLLRWWQWFQYCDDTLGMCETRTGNTRAFTTEQVSDALNNED